MIKNIRIIYIPFILLFSLIQSSFSLNLQKVPINGQNSFFEVLDSEPWDNNHLLTSGVDGLHVFLIIDDEIQYSGTNDEARIYNVWASGSLGMGARRAAGATIFEMSLPQSPEVMYRFIPNGYVIEDGVLVENRWWFVAHEDGLLTFIHDDQGNYQNLLDEELFDSWAIIPHSDSLLYIADGGGGLAVVSIDEEGGAEHITTIPTSGTAIDVKFENELLVVAVGESGVDVFDISNPQQPEFLRNINTPTFCNHVSISNSNVAVADWEQVLIYNAENGDLLAYKYAEYRAMGVHMEDENVYLADWSRYLHYRYGPVEGPDIEVNPRNIDLSFVPENESVDTTFTIKNVGYELLDVNNIMSVSPAFVIDLETADVEPGDSLFLQVNYTHDPDLLGNTRIEFTSNDGDEPVLNRRVIGHGGWLALGDPAPDLTVPLLDGGEFTLSDFLGEVVMIVFWASW